MVGVRVYFGCDLYQFIDLRQDNVRNVRQNMFMKQSQVILAAQFKFLWTQLKRCSCKSIERTWDSFLTREWSLFQGVIIVGPVQQGYFWLIEFSHFFNRPVLLCIVESKLSINVFLYRHLIITVRSGALPRLIAKVLLSSYDFFVITCLKMLYYLMSIQVPCRTGMFAVRTFKDFLCLLERLFKNP